MDYARKMKQVLDAIGIRTAEEPNPSDSEPQMRRTHSDMTQILMKSNAMICLSKSDSNLRRRYSEPSVLSQTNVYSIKSNFSRRSSSLESILSKISRVSGIASTPPPITTCETMNSSQSYQKSTDFLNVPQ